ncbi:unnamed protein product [marine sediment metagenome]|uniref:Uncharacterized protein n=1 Tax=marine sediment metagenome TaxID=412755 RepID=X0TW89_9ZZZZ
MTQISASIKPQLSEDEIECLQRIAAKEIPTPKQVNGDFKWECRVCDWKTNNLVAYGEHYEDEHGGR